MLKQQEHHCSLILILKKTKKIIQDYLVSTIYRSPLSEIIQQVFIEWPIFALGGSVCSVSKNMYVFLMKKNYPKLNLCCLTSSFHQGGSLHTSRTFIWGALPHLSWAWRERGAMLSFQSVHQFACLDSKEYETLFRLSQIYIRAERKQATLVPSNTFILALTRLCASFRLSHFSKTNGKTVCRQVCLRFVGFLAIEERLEVQQATFRNYLEEKMYPS